MMNRGARLLIGTLVGALSGVTAFAQESGAYLGGSFGQATFKEWCDTSAAPPGFVFTACDDKDTAWKLFGGYRFNRQFAVEATYVNWGMVTANTPSIAVSAEQQSMGIAAVGSLELGPRFSVFGKAGLLRTEQESRRVTATSSTDFEGDETEFHYGFGAKYAVGQNWALRAEWERTEKLEVEMISIGAEFRF
jgi:OOP family OmpA-OmpF porin